MSQAGNSLSPTHVLRSASERSNHNCNCIYVILKCLTGILELLWHPIVIRFFSFSETRKK
ncbi:hypothetical protein BLOT_005572 [Blomia tropicalis]|nr:hypothetical protein BLOT_005572 [Blomia tropicalis]